MNRKKQLEMVTDKICCELGKCEDRACDMVWQARFHRIKRKIEETPVHSMDLSMEILEMTEELKACMEKNRLQMAEVYLSRLDGLIETVRQGEGKDRNMGLRNKLSSLLGRKKEDPQDKLLHSQKEDAKKKIFQLQKRIVEFSEERSGILDEFNQKLKECAAYEADSCEYKLARQQAQHLRKRIAETEKQIQFFANLLQKNEDYHNMLRTGEITFELRDYMPDGAEADVLMQRIAEETEDITANIDTFGQTIDKYARILDAASPSDVLAEDKEFDDMVQKLRKEQEAVKKEPAEPETVKQEMAESCSAHTEEDNKTEKEFT